ncbi:FMN-binding negative transcriptional regulator [Rudaea sp.]|uniref:FMN-binding negative transcriptional regulator n=1 Tax=Rudaea sp. TaxID=2136325 RepID=UPI00321F63C9
MHIPAAFSETRIDVMWNLMREHPLATLVIAGERGLDAHHLPMYLEKHQGPSGALHGHIARANRLVADCAQPSDALAVFHGPEAYITPSWYATKRETGKVVPTWNYVAVHAHGRLRLIDDSQWLHAHLERLVGEHEAGETTPWKISDAPADYIETMLRGIVGFELEIVRLEGKWKASQNHPAANREGVIDGLRRRATPAAQAMADVVRERGPR